MDITSCRRRGRPRQVPVDEEATFAPQIPHSQEEPQVPQGFSIPPMPQPDFFPPMTPKAYQAYANFWYAQVQAGKDNFLCRPQRPSHSLRHIRGSNYLSWLKRLDCWVVRYFLGQLRQLW